MKRYEDIIDREHPISKKHPRMSQEDRAAQFAPFAALSGHKEKILETAEEQTMRMDSYEVEEIDDI